MEWRDRGLVIGLRRHGETSAIAEIMTREHGRHLGLVRGARSAERRAVLQPGNDVHIVWRARLSEHLGTFTLEPIVMRTALLMDRAPALHGLNLIGALLRLLAERERHGALCDAAERIADRLAGEADLLLSAALLVRFELAILAELGFGLDLACCAATGERQDLAYVSPKSGRAVGRDSGLPWADRLLALPRFLHADAASAPTEQDVAQAFALTGYFLRRDLFDPRGLPLPDARAAFLGSVAQSARQPDARATP